MYKPNFCAECGERITRARWHLWTSRSFCDTCARRMSKARILFPLATIAVLFSSGLITGFSVRRAPPPLIVERGPVSALPVSGKNTADAQADAKSGGSDSPSAPKADASYGPDGSATERPTDPNEVVSICGARTKKGTPCSRRVRGTGRCWQHKGMPAMLPPEKLVVTGN
jgi:hypothetical protein